VGVTGGTKSEDEIFCGNKSRRNFLMMNKVSRG